MDSKENLITLNQLQILLGIKESTIKVLIRTQQLPQSLYTGKGSSLKFKLHPLLQWFELKEGIAI